jgi:hypothetical protein
VCSNESGIESRRTFIGCSPVGQDTPGGTA